MGKAGKAGKHIVVHQDNLLEKREKLEKLENTMFFTRGGREGEGVLTALLLCAYCVPIVFRLEEEEEEEERRGQGMLIVILYSYFVVLLCSPFGGGWRGKEFVLHCCCLHSVLL